MREMNMVTPNISTNIEQRMRALVREGNSTLTIERKLINWVCPDTSRAVAALK